MFNICDAPKPWGTYFQDTASPQMEALTELHDNIMYYLVIIMFAVGWIMVSIIGAYAKNKISNKYVNHGALIELVWTVAPALILILIAFPSFKLLYLMDEVTDPNLTVFAEGHQWYWSYQYPDFLSDDDEELEFDSYLLPESYPEIINLSADDAGEAQSRQDYDKYMDQVNHECEHSWQPRRIYDGVTNEYFVKWDYMVANRGAAVRTAPHLLGHTLGSPDSVLNRSHYCVYCYTVMCENCYRVLMQ